MSEEEFIDELIEATKDGDNEEISNLLDRGANVDGCDGYWNTSLHFATYYGNIKAVVLLLNHGAGVNIPNGDGKTPLFYAIIGENMEIAKILLDHGANVDVFDKFAYNPLLSASKRKNTEMVKLLLTKNADPNVYIAGWYPIHIAAVYGRVKTVAVLLDHGVDINASDDHKSTPLHLASSFGNTKVVKFLLGCGANVNAFDKNNNTPLHKASRHGHAKAVALLLEHGADLSASNKNGKNPIDLIATTFLAEKRNEGATIRSLFQQWSRVVSLRVLCLRVIHNYQQVTVPDWFPPFLLEWPNVEENLPSDGRKKRKRS